MKKHLPLAALIAVNMIIGLFVLPGFGESTDELSQHSYAERTIQAVQSLMDTGQLSSYFFEEEPKQGSHGPAFIMVVTLLRNAFLPDGTQIERLRFSHYLYFMVFQVGIISIYFLSRRWMSELASLGTALLFNTQPLLLGHSFMNPKDIVFMSMLTASAALGLWMVDRGDREGMPATNKPLPEGIRSFLNQFLSVDVWLAGFVLGFASAIRLAAPLIGVVILVYILVSRKWRLLPRLAAYGLIAFGFMILLWPYLWPDPLGRLIESVGHSVAYPNVHLTLFRGTVYDANDIPRSYLPVLLAIQLTESTLILMIVGAFALLKKFRWDLASLVIVWFALPAALIILTRVNLYNNTRQVFFILPPLFLIAGLGLDWLLTYLRNPVTRLATLLLFLLPGLYANVALYPYQYIYYNQLVGGVHGAYRNFELDYWDLSFMEAQTYVNQVAGSHANIYVGDSKPSALTFARSDLIFNAFGNKRKNWGQYDYIIVSTANNTDEKFSDFPTIFIVERAGVPLILVKQPYRIQE